MCFLFCKLLAGDISCIFMFGVLSALQLSCKLEKCFWDSFSIITAMTEDLEVRWRKLVVLLIMPYAGGTGPYTLLQQPYSLPKYVKEASKSYFSIICPLKRLPWNSTGNEGGSFLTHLWKHVVVKQRQEIESHDIDNLLFVEYLENEIISFHYEDIAWKHPYQLFLYCWIPKIWIKYLYFDPLG